MIICEVGIKMISLEFQYYWHCFVSTGAFISKLVVVTGALQIITPSLIQIYICISLQQPASQPAWQELGVIRACKLLLPKLQSKPSVRFDLELKRQEEYYLSNKKSSNKVLNYGSKLPACLSQVTLMKIPKHLSTVSVIKQSSTMQTLVSFE